MAQIRISRETAEALFKTRSITSNYERKIAKKRIFSGIKSENGIPPRTRIKVAIMTEDAPKYLVVCDKRTGMPLTNSAPEPVIAVAPAGAVAAATVEAAAEAAKAPAKAPAKKVAAKAPAKKVAAKAPAKKVAAKAPAKKVAAKAPAKKVAAKAPAKKVAAKAPAKKVAKKAAK